MWAGAKDWRKETRQGKDKKRGGEEEQGSHSGAENRGRSCDSEMGSRGKPGTRRRVVIQEQGMRSALWRWGVGETCGGGLETVRVVV